MRALASAYGVECMSRERVAGIEQSIKKKLDSIEQCHNAGFTRSRDTGRATSAREGEGVLRQRQTLRRASCNAFAARKKCHLSCGFPP